MEKRKAIYPQKPHATSQPSRFSHTPRLSTGVCRVCARSGNKTAEKRLVMHGELVSAIAPPWSPWLLFWCFCVVRGLYRLGDARPLLLSPYNTTLEDAERGTHEQLHNLA